MTFSRRARTIFLIAATLTVSANLASITAQPADSVADLARRSAAAFRQANPDEALALADRAVALDPDHAELRQFRAQLRFRSGRVAGSVEDFDAAVRLDPSALPFNWQRGIALYYAGRYADGAAQFESHRTVNPDDVENPVWHFLCVARAESLEAARARLLPVGPDSRIPMPTIYQLFAGRASPDDVLAAADRDADTIGRDALDDRLFHANLYIGLYLDITGRPADALPYVHRAAEVIAPTHYMGDVARVHLRDLRARLEAPAPDPAVAAPNPATPVPPRTPAAPTP